MPAAVAALPLPATSTPLQSMLVDAAVPSIVGGDFAALLLGQLSADAGTEALTENTDLSLSLPADMLATSSSAPLDPALLLASMGMTTIQPPPARPDLISEPTTDMSTTVPAGLTMALPQIPGVAQLPPPADKQVPTEGLLKISDQPAPQTQATLVTASPNETPAKLAGFEQKLADAVQGITETPPSPQQLASAAQVGGSVAAPARHTNEAVRIDAPLKDQAWPAELGQKVVWMATQDKQSAQITLNPPQLGPIEISLSVKSDQATAVFASANADVREAIESALPRLREMLAGVGVELGQTNVSAESFRQQNDSNNNGRNNTTGRNDDAGNISIGRGETRVATSAIKRGNGLVDTFA